MNEFYEEHDILDLSELSEHDITWEKIMSMPSESIIEKILEFCEEHYLDISEVLHIFETKEYKELLYTDCVLNSVIKDKELKKILDSRLVSWDEEF